MEWRRGRNLSRRRAISVLLTVLVLFTWLPAVAQAEFVRRIGDQWTHRKDGLIYVDYYSAQYNYWFGRSEGKPTRGPNPVPGRAFGSRDVDTLYDMVPVVHQYYLDTFGRNGPNGLGGTSDGVSFPHNYYIIQANIEGVSGVAGYNGTTAIGFGYANHEVVGHEMFHYVQHAEFGAGRNYYTDPHLKEFGAIMEGMSDFFGEALERYATGSTDWTLRAGSNEYRSLMDPTSALSPPDGIPNADRYLSPYFRTEIQGTYPNSGVIAKASYLASEGGFFNGYDVVGLGFDKVEQIWFRALTDYFAPDETYNMAYHSLLNAANDLYGQEDADKLKVALQAVEMDLPRVVPEPSSFVLMAMGAVVVGWSARKRRLTRRHRGAIVLN